MDSIRVVFWLKLALVVLTSFIVITYIFKPSDNQCQMTFMMEPPRFIPVPIDTPLYKLDGSPLIDIRHSLRHKYKLFMYSEFGFPLESDIRRDLKDSMPVLFVPGNAGSYQQVRSLASTCIRRQLRSLDAFKFIFYTIDFQAQLSGLSGDLVEDQIDFLHLAINQIVGSHPSETNGVIVIGHSIGGFVAKALLTKSNFDTDMVPLLINLASPLTRPFVSFDLKMHHLYGNISAQWPIKRKNSNTLTISISGGKSDRLVPVHLSLDSQYDMSLTTSSIDELWLTTDHVSITWCRELMDKLSRLLSALMDKRHTKLIEDKARQIAIVRDELLTLAIPYGLQIDTAPTSREPKLVNTDNVVQIGDHFSATRADLLESSIILNLTAKSGEDVFIWLEHIDSFKESSLFGCQEVVVSTNQARCDGKINLIDHFRKIPSRRFELKKKSLTISNDKQIMKFIILDFSSHLGEDPRNNKIPENIGIQTIKNPSTNQLQVPTFPNYLISRILRQSSLVRELRAPVAQIKTYTRYELVNLNHSNKHLNIIIETSSCALDYTPSETIALLVQDKYVEQRFYTKGNSDTVIVKLNSHRTILMGDSKNQSKSYLELFLDGKCVNKLRLEYDTWGLLEDLIQSLPGEILACSCYLAYISILLKVNLFTEAGHGSSATSSLWNWLMGTSGYVIMYTASRLTESPSSDLDAQISQWFGVLLLSSGLVALTEYVINRLVDLATIFNNIQTVIGERIASHRASRQDASNKNTNPSGSDCYTSQIKLDYEWPVVILTAIGGLFISEALMRLCIVFMMLKLKLKLSILKQLLATPTNMGAAPINRPQCAPSTTSNQVIDRAYDLALSVTTLNIISLICSIPTVLLMINSSGISLQVDTNYIVSLVTLILAKCTSQGIESYAITGITISPYTISQRLWTFIPKRFHILSLLPMLLVSRNIRVLNCVELVILVWVAGSLSRSRNEVKKKKTD